MKMIFKTSINYFYTLNVIVVHILGIYGLFIGFSNETNWKTVVYHLVLGNLSQLAALMGAHRLWAHKSYQANKLVQVILLILGLNSGQSPAYIWARDHRVHHKYVDTDADPYNVNRGLFFAQIGWICMRKTKEFHEKVKTINLDDLKSNPLVMFQYNYYLYLIYPLWILFASVPYFFWNENLFSSFCLLCFGVVMSGLHVGTINSLSHYWGWKPYDTGMEPTFSRLVAYLTFGEGYHNFHHTFPKDYTQSELHWSENFNISAFLIDVLGYCGMVKPHNRVDPELIAKRRERTGDMTVKIRPWSSILDQIMGLIVVNWAIWLVFGIRYLTVKSV